MKKLRLDLSPPIPKLHIVTREDYRNSIVDRFSMVFFVLYVFIACSQNPLKLLKLFLNNP